MRYLNALLRGEEISPHTRGEEPSKPSKPLRLVQRETPPFPQPQAETWLQSQLASGPQHIASLVAEWVGTLDHPTGRDMDDLMAARWTLDVQAYVGEDDRMWWTLPGDWSLWPCEHCGNPAVVEDVGPSLDGQRTLTHWYCGTCQTWGTTPDTLREPPVWVLRTVH